MNRISRMTLLATLLSLALPFTAAADDDSGKKDVLKVALWGDEFYNDDPATKAAMIDQTIDSMNKHNLDFTIFAGDTRNGSTQCTDQAIGQDVADIFNRLKAPTLYTPGDNEWTDCL